MGYPRTGYMRSPPMASAATAGTVAVRDANGDASFHKLTQTVNPSIAGVTQPSWPLYPTSSADLQALLTAGGLNGASLIGALYEIWVVVGARMYGMVNGHHLARTLTTWTGIGPGLSPWGPGRSLSVVEGASTSCVQASANTVLELADETTASDLLLLMDYSSPATSANYVVASKVQGAAGPFWNAGVSQAGEMQWYLHDGTHQIAPVSTGLGLRDTKLHHLGFGLTWGQTGAELRWCADAGAVQTTSKSTVTSVANTGKFSIGGSPSFASPAEFGTSYMIAFQGAAIDAVNIATIMTALGWAAR